MLFVAGGDTGQAYVYDATTGRPLGVFQLTTGTTFVNDVIATRRAAYFTDSFKPQLYKVPIEGKGDFGTPETLPLTGDLVFEDGFNTNGIDATANGRRLVVVQSNTGELFRVDPETGVTREIDLGGQTVVNGDGILLDGSQRLWVVQNADNLLTLVRVNPLLRSGRIAGRFTDDSFDVPTTVAKAAGHLAVVNARFGTPSPNTAEYWVTQIPRPRP
jgi:outer membrane protein assembly factor BamB